MSLISKAQFNITGGIILPENKSQSSQSPLQICPLPEQLIIPLNMHAGTDAIAIVEVGETIGKGQNIAKADRAISAFIHSPVAGQVVDIKSMPVANRSGVEETVLIIDCDSEQSDLYNEISDWSNQTAEQLLEKVRLAGIVGLGGAGFPSDQKIKSSLSSHTLILNGAECEPYISCDHRAMDDFAPQILEGALILATILDCENIQIAIEDNKSSAINSMANSLKESANGGNKSPTIEIIEIPTRYPSGGERQLIEIISGKQVPSNSLPSVLGYTVQNVATALAVSEAVVRDKPLLDRIVTVTGKAVSRPGNYRVTLGTSIRYLLEFAGWDESKCSRLIHGGPMMGFPMACADRPISKTSNCIIAGTIEEFPAPLAEQTCIRCGQCADVCPATLIPQQLYWFSRSGEINKALDHRLMDCIECGACAYVCPSQIPLVDYYRYSKGEVKSRKATEEKASHSKQRFDFRNQRLENNRLEKARLREERAKLAAKAKTDDPKKQAIADALARIKAKKQANASASTSGKEGNKNA